MKNNIQFDKQAVISFSGGRRAALGVGGETLDGAIVSDTVFDDKCRIIISRRGVQVAEGGAEGAAGSGSGRSGGTCKARRTSTVLEAG